MGKRRTVTFKTAKRHMKGKKTFYEAPVTEVIEIRQEGIVCASGEVPGMSHGWDIDDFYTYNGR